MDLELFFIIVFPLLMIPLGFFCYHDKNKRAAKANAKAMKEMLEQLDRERNEEKNKES